MLLLNSSVGFWLFLIVEGALGDEQVSDIVPVACQAAAQAGVPSVCVSNFRYVFIVLAPPGVGGGVVWGYKPRAIKSYLSGGYKAMPIFMGCS